MGCILPYQQGPLLRPSGVTLTIVVIVYAFFLQHLMHSISKFFIIFLLSSHISDHDKRFIKLSYLFLQKYCFLNVELTQRKQKPP